MFHGSSYVISNFFGQWQSLRPMLWLVCLSRFKSTVKLCILYFVSICRLALGFKPLLFAVVSFLLKSVYGSHGISHLSLDKVMFFKLFLSLNYFLSMLHMFYSRNVKLFSIFLFSIDIYFSQNSTILFPMIPAMLWTFQLRKV